MSDYTRRLEKEIQLDPYNSIVFGAACKTDIYIVGGYARDILLKRRIRDRDYVVGGSVDRLVESVVRLTHGRWIKLGDEGLNRIALRDGGTLDFAPIRGDIESDLSCRDFSINAIAWSPTKGLFDPKNGIADLKRGLLRMVDAANMISDPLRILRAYRFAGELSFKIERTTRSALRRLSSLICNTSTERITSEFFRILNLRNPVATVEMLLEDGLLASLIGSIDSTYENLDHKVKALSDLYRRFDTDLKYSINLERIFSQGLKRSGLIALELLIQDLPVNRFVLSRRIARRISRLGKVIAFLDSQDNPSALRRDQLFDLFEASGDAISDLLLIRNLPRYAGPFEKYRRIQRRGLLTADEVRAAVGAVSGPALGAAIRAVKKAEFQGDVHDSAEAEHFLRAGGY